VSIKPNRQIDNATVFDIILLYQCCHTILDFLDDLDAFGQVTPRFANICRSAGSLAVMALKCPALKRVFATMNDQ
jgi:hypothetical protein